VTLAPKPVTAVEVSMVTHHSCWQKYYQEFADQQQALLKQREVVEK
jgi:hypothetical protein